MRFTLRWYQSPRQYLQTINTCAVFTLQVCFGKLALPSPISRPLTFSLTHSNPKLLIAFHVLHRCNRGQHFKVHNVKQGKRFKSERAKLQCDELQFTAATQRQSRLCLFKFPIVAPISYQVTIKQHSSLLCVWVSPIGQAKSWLLPFFLPGNRRNSG